MSNKGYYIKARKIKDSWIAHASPCVREIWDYLLREACFQEVKYKGYTLQRGQLFRDYSEIREDLHWKIGYRKMMYSESQTKRAMKALMKDGMVELTRVPRGNVITVLKYELYQDPKNYERTNEHSKSEPRANQERTNGVLSIKEECKEYKNVKNEKKEAAQKPPEFSGKETKLQRQYKDGTVALYELGCLSDSDREAEWYTEAMRYYDGIREEDLDHVRFPIRLREEPLKSVILYLAFRAKRFSTRERSHVKAFIRGICNPKNDFWRRFCDSTEQALGSMYDIIDEAPKTLE